MQSPPPSVSLAQVTGLASLSVLSVGPVDSVQSAGPRPAGRGVTMDLGLRILVFVLIGLLSPSKSATENSPTVQLTLDGQPDGCPLVQPTGLVFKAIVSVDSRSDLKLKVSCIVPGDDFGPLHFHDIKVPGCPTNNIVEKPNPKAPNVTDSFEVELCSTPGTATIEFKADLVHTIFVGKQKVKLGTAVGTTNEWKEICFDVDLPLMNTTGLSSTNASLRCLSTADGSCNSPELGTFWDF
ncbi:unnamed protein product, partial [Darwinula stevensoni]